MFRSDNRGLMRRSATVNITVDVVCAALERLAVRIGTLVRRDKRKKIMIGDVNAAVELEFGAILAGGSINFAEEVTNRIR